MIHFVGAGPGAPDLITLRGARLLAEADVVVYAGSLVNPELLKNCKASCKVYDSSRMTLDQIVDVLCDADAHGLACVRLHTGDPALYGAHGEQMDELDKHGVSYDIVPGVSSLFGASAALGVEYTVPGVTQSVVITRMEGSTPMPKGEELAGFAAHGCTLVLFLSASLLHEVQEELLAGGLPVSMPAALVVRATWPDEAVYRCDVGSLATCATEHNVTRTALVVVGQCLRARDARSLLYSADFSHGFREAEHGGQPDQPRPLDKLMEDVRAYVPCCEQEVRDKEQMLSFMCEHDDCLERSNLVAHVTTSIWTVNPARTKALMVYHSIYDSWSWIGGHADGVADLRAVALRELREETGVAGARLASCDILSLETLTVDAHMRRGQYVPSHLHFNVTYLAEADEDEVLIANDQENKGVRWFTFSDALAASSEPWMVEHVYKKLVACSVAGSKRDVLL